MELIRRFEEGAEQAYMRGLVHGTMHLSIGQEASAVGVGINLLAQDCITSTHRGHGHCIAKGAEPKYMFAEFFGKDTGYCRGRGGSMHIADVAGGNLGANGIVGGGIPIAVGAAPGAGIVALMGAVLTWLFGFDVLYSLQDEAFDRARGLHSVPVRFGTRGALRLSAAAHVATVTLLVVAGALLHRGPAYFAGAALFGAVLVIEHRLVRGGDLGRIDKAFFDCNALVSLGFFGTTVLDAWLLAR